MWLKIKQGGYAGFGPCFHSPGFHFGIPVFEPQPFRSLVLWRKEIGEISGHESFRFPLSALGFWCQTMKQGPLKSLGKHPIGSPESRIPKRQKTFVSQGLQTCKADWTSPDGTLVSVFELESRPTWDCCWFRFGLPSPTKQPKYSISLWFPFDFPIKTFSPKDTNPNIDTRSVALKTPKTAMCGQTSTRDPSP